MNHKTHSVAVYDLGLFMCMAEKLAESYGKVYYYSPWQSPYPRSNSRLLGFGLKNVERVNNFFDIIDDTDLFVFPDCFDGDLHVHLEKLGKRVWGCKKGEELELFRPDSKEHQKSLGIDIGNYEVIIGLKNLRQYLKDNNNQWIKNNVTRGDFESFHAETYSLVEPRLDELEWKLGPKKNNYEFIVEEAIDDAIEIGYDGYTVDGKFPKSTLFGIEKKAVGYIGAFKEYKDLPGQLIDLNTKISGTLKEYQYRGFISSEVRVKNKTGYSLDWCCRQPSPPSELYINLYTNLSDILWEGAEGKCIDPVPAGKFGAQIVLYSEWANKNWQAIEFPKELKNNIILRNHAFIDGKHWIVPQETGSTLIGSVIAIADSFDNAIGQAKEYADQVKSYDIECQPEILDKAKEDWGKLEKL